MQLTALALPTYPPSFGWVPQPLSMKEVKEPCPSMGHPRMGHPSLRDASLAGAFHLSITWITPAIVARRWAFVFGIQSLDRCHGILNQTLILGQGFTVCIAEIGQQGKDQPGFGVAKIMQLELVSERIDFLTVGDQCGDNNQ